jgi:hypothetical protein
VEVVAQQELERNKHSVPLGQKCRDETHLTKRGWKPQDNVYLLKYIEPPGMFCQSIQLGSSQDLRAKLHIAENTRVRETT